MMDPVHPWVDSLEMRRLAEALMSPLPTSPQESPDAGFSGDFVGYAEGELMPRMESVNASAFSIAPLPVESLAARELPLQNPSDTVIGPAQGLAYFGEWLRLHYPTDGFFIYDDRGELIFDDGDHERFHFMVRNLALVRNSSSNDSGHVRLKIGSATLLEIIPVETMVGRMVLGLIVEQPLNANDIEALSMALQRAVAPSET
jgi:hypothetical protein